MNTSPAVRPSKDLVRGSLSPWIERNPPPAPLVVNPLSPKNPVRGSLSPEVAQQIERVSERAYALAVARIRTYAGNTLSPAHQLAIRRMVVGFSYLAAKVCTGRVAYSIDIGGGKSVAIAAWVASLYEHRDSVPWTCAVAASQVEALCTMRRSLLLNYGIPYESSGLWHSLGAPDSKANEGKNIMPSDSVEQLSHRRVALVTHARIATPAALDRLNTYRAPAWDGQCEPQSRGVVLFDEALYTSAHFTANLLDLESDLGTLGPQVRKRFGSRPNAPEVSDYVEMVDYLTESFKLLKAEGDALDYRDPKVLTLPELDDTKRTAFLAAHNSMAGYLPGLMGAAREVIEAGYLPVTLIRANLGNAAIAFTTAVPDALNRMAILDASYQIDKLAQNDASITSDPLCPSAVKDYHTLTIMALQRGAGRSSVYKNVAGDLETTGEVDSICKAVVEVVTALPPEEAVLLFTFLPRKFKGKVIDVRTILEVHLALAGVDLNATVTAQDDTGAYTQRPRINFSTWGKERGSNAFAYCRNVMLVGILTRDEAEMRSALHAAHRSLTADVTTRDVRDAILSADAIVAQQALARGNIRQTEHGNAGVMKAWLFHRNVRALRVDLDRVFPNARWQKWETQYLRELQVKVNDLADGIREYLLEQPATVARVNIPAMRKALVMLKADGVPDKTFQRAKVAALSYPDVAPHWKHDGGRLIVRK